MRYETIEDGYWLRLEAGEAVMPELLQFLEQKKVGAGFISGIGALRDVTLGYFHLSEKEYRRHHFNEIVELVSFSGNITLVDGKPFIHAHAVIADVDCVPHAGHFFNAVVAVTMEVHIRRLSRSVEREHDQATGLKLLALKYPAK